MSQLSITPEVGHLFRELLKIPEGCQLFCNQLQVSTPAVIGPLTDRHVKVTAITDDVNTDGQAHKHATDKLFVVANPDLALFNPIGKFHLGFSGFPFSVQTVNPDTGEPIPEKDQVQPLFAYDRCQFFKCSEGKDERKVALHILGLEQMLQATLHGGFFGAVLPKRWIGREMRYLGWWRDNAATVANIKLPPAAVQWNGQPAAGDWQLCIWNRPVTEHSKYRNLGYAKFRFSPFQFPLETFGSQLDDCVRAFHSSEWYSMAVAHWHDALEAMHADKDWGTWRTHPLEVDDPKDMYFFTPKPQFKTGVRIMETVEEIKRLRHSVHVKPGRVIRLSCEDATSQGALLDLRVHMGATIDERSGATVFNYDRELKLRPFTDIKEQLLSNLENQGLIPCMTKSEHHKLMKKERWLSIQLTPIERYIPATKAAQATGGSSTGNASQQQSGEEDDWELAYEDTGMEATFPEIMDMWRKRAKFMNLDRPGLTFEFQFEDLIYYAAKGSLANTSVMGLGKTRLTLFAALLRGNKRNLIVVPARLLGVWQDEIDNTITPYCRVQRKDWQGRVLNSSCQVVEWARDLYPANMKTFNLVSYDKLKSIARDGQFFKCPTCGTVTYSGRPKGQELQTCPGDPLLPEDDNRRCNNKIQRWRRVCQGPDYQGSKDEKYLKRKFRVVANTDGSPVLKENGDYHRIHWSKLTDYTGQKFPLETTCVIDERPPRPKVVAMEKQDHMFKKVVKKPVEVINEQNGVGTIEYKSIDRTPHLRWTFSKLVRNRFSHVYLDEALQIMNEASQRSLAINMVNGRNRVINTGTPFKNMPENLVPLFNWCFSREVFPNYRPYGLNGLSGEGIGRFVNKYRTEVYVGGYRMPDGTIEGGVPKAIPKVNNPELFQAEMAPLMRRHTRNEPKVLRDIPRKVLIESHETIDMDDEHRAYYKLWLDKFAEWWQKMKEEEDKEKVPPGALITKLGYLINADTVPHFMLDGILAGKDEDAKKWAAEIGKYTGKRAPSKMRRAWEMIKANIAAGDKTILTSWRRANLNLSNDWCARQKIASMIVDGTVSLTINKQTGRSKRHEMVEQFRHYDYWVLNAGLEALAEGFNIPEANHAILLDTGWAPTAPKQLIGRMIRPAQTKTIYADYVMHKGTIGEYMFALSYLKGRSADEAIDYMEFDDFSTDVIPDIHQYADAIVDGKEEIVKQAMWLAVDHLKRQIKQEGEEDA